MTDPRVDAYIAESAAFAQPILVRLRALVHEACPQAKETIKWGMPTFVLAGRNLCGMAAFKQHVSFGFWQHALVMGEGVARDGMGSIGRLASLRDLPSRTRMLALIRKAVRLNMDGVKTPRTPAASTAPRSAPPMPDDLAAALALPRHAQARRHFAAFAPSYRRDYIEWLSEARREETRARRLAQALEWLAEGKPRNWKYMNR